MELHFNAALLKGVRIAFVFQFPSGSFVSLLFSCFALQDLFEYLPNAEQIHPWRTSLCALPCCLSTSSLIDHVSHCSLILYDGIFYLALQSACVLIYCIFHFEIATYRNIFLSHACVVSGCIMAALMYMQHLTCHSISCQRLDESLMNPWGKVGHCRGWEDIR